MAGSATTQYPGKANEFRVLDARHAAMRMSYGCWMFDALSRPAGPFRSSTSSSRRGARPSLSPAAAQSPSGSQMIKRPHRVTTPPLVIGLAAPSLASVFMSAHAKPLSALRSGAGVVARLGVRQGLLGSVFEVASGALGWNVPKPAGRFMPAR